MNDHRASSSSAFAVAEPEEVGLTAAGLSRLTAVMQREVDARRVPGVSMLIARGGKVGYRRDIGALRPGGPALPGDAIFRIYSMTKPIVSVALMMLVEEGRLFIADPLAKFIPEFADPKVGVERDGKLELVAAKRPITIQDLLRHTSGLTYAFTGVSAVQRLYAKAQRWDAPDLTNAQLVAALAKLPLIDQPGTSWDYGHSTDVVGRIIEIVSGQSLGAFLQERILTPLGMSDTAFFVPPDKHDRVAEPFAKDPDTGESVKLSTPTTTNFESGGGGLVVDDGRLRAVCADALSRRRARRHALLGRKTLEFMTADHLGPNVRIGNHFPAGAGTWLRARLRGAARGRTWRRRPGRRVNSSGAASPARRFGSRPRKS